MYRMTLTIGFVLRIVMVILFSYHYDTAGNWHNGLNIGLFDENDAAGFHKYASDYSKMLNQEETVFMYEDVITEDKRSGIGYFKMLGVLYFLTKDTRTIGNIFSVIAWLASALVLVRIMRLLLIHRSNQIKGMMVYALLPSSIFYTSLTLREVFQLLLVNLLILSALKIYIHRSKFHWFALLCFAWGLSTLHIGLFVFGILLVLGLGGITLLFQRKNISLVKVIILFPAILILGLFVIKKTFLADLMPAYDNSLLQMYASQRLTSAAGGGRTNYVEFYLMDDQERNSLNWKKFDHLKGLPPASNYDIILQAVVSFYQYMFEPVPWKISVHYDWVILIENLLRLWLVWQTVKGLHRMPANNRKPTLFIFVAYLVLESLWALGTVTWGTASRHHIPAFGMLVVTAFSYRNHCSKAWFK